MWRVAYCGMIYVLFSAVEHFFESVKFIVKIKNKYYSKVFLNFFYK